MSTTIETLLTYIGLYTLVFYLYDVLKAPLILSFHFLKKCLGCRPLRLKEKYGTWAAITGASDGIGKEYARELAALGINVVLISRSAEKLNVVARDIEHEFFVKTKTVVVDFSTGKEACKQVEEQLKLIPVRILVNNVGQGPRELGPMAACSDDELWSMIFTNIGAVTQLSRYFMKRLHKEHNSGIIVNVSSGTAYFPLPNSAVYAASKAYVHSMTLALQEEARPYGIDVQLLSPHAVDTKMLNFSNWKKYNKHILPSAATFARSAVNRLGKVTETTGYIKHDLEYAVLKACPQRLMNFLVKLFLKILTPPKETRNF